jgi:peptidoglycan biosynthesis protein MviN/MurJ (putative lipid II flippase)
MLLKAGVLSLALLLASRLLGLGRESVQAAALGTSGLADVAVLMLTLPDWLTGVAASGALAYVLVPAWAGRAPTAVAGLQRQVARVLLVLGVGVALVWAVLALHGPLVSALAAGLPADLSPVAAQALVWSAIAFPLALLAALWGTRLQHERDFVGLYAANLVVNGVLIVALVVAGRALAAGDAVVALGAGLLGAMTLRLAWQAWRLPARPVAPVAVADAPQTMPLPAASVWTWAVLSAGLPLALPFVARSLASQGGEGALATFNYAWKLVELPLVLAIQLVATLAFPAVARAVTQGLQDPAAREPVRIAFALAFALACACAAGLLVGADALAQLLFGWGRMQGPALAQVAEWGRVAAMGLPPQAVVAVALTVLASQGRMRPAAALYGAALLALLGLAATEPRDGAALMAVLNAVFIFVAVGLLMALGAGAARCLPVRAMVWPLGALLVVAALLRATGGAEGLPMVATLALAVLAGLAVLAAAWHGAGAMRLALRR